MTDNSNLDSDVEMGTRKIKEEYEDEKEATDGSAVYLHLIEENLSLKSDDDDGKYSEEVKIKTEVDDIIIIDEDDTTPENPGSFTELIIKTEQNIEDEEEEETNKTEQVINDADSTMEADGKREHPTAVTATSDKDNVNSDACTSTNVLVKSDISNLKIAMKAKSDKDDNANNLSRNLWVMNLLPSTRAMELKQLLSRCGKVIGAKIVQSSRFSQHRCYGFVTMETQAAADRCVETLNHTELNGQSIRVAKVKTDCNIPKNPKKPTEVKTKNEKKIKSQNEVIKNTKPQNGASKNTKEKAKKETSSLCDNKEINNKKENKRRESRSTKRSCSKDQSIQSSSAKPKPRAEHQAEVLTFDKIKAVHDRERSRSRSRTLRLEEQHRREIQLARDILSRQRVETLRLDRERERLRTERERLVREREELMRLERERQRQERHKLEEERAEFRRQEVLLEQVRRTVKRCSEAHEEGGADRKRPAATTQGSYADHRSDAAVFDVLSRQPSSKLPHKKDPSPDYHSRSPYPKRIEEYPKRIEAYPKRVEEYPKRIEEYPKRIEEYPKRDLERKRDYATVERHSGHSRLAPSSGSTISTKGPAYVSRDKERDAPQRRKPNSAREPSPRLIKDTRYRERSNERSSIPFRPVRDERDRRLDREPVRDERDRRLDRDRDRERDRDHHMKSDARSSRDVRYAEPPIKEESHFRDMSAWHGSRTVSPGVKQFGSNPDPSRGIWRPMDNNSGQRWDNHSSRLIMSTSSTLPNMMYSGSNMNNPAMGSVLASAPIPPTYPPIERFDRFKSNNSRLY